MTSGDVEGCASQRHVPQRVANLLWYLLWLPLPQSNTTHHIVQGAMVHLAIKELKVLEWHVCTRRPCWTPAVDGAVLQPQVREGRADLGNARERHVLCIA